MRARGAGCAARTEPSTPRQATATAAIGTLGNCPYRDSVRENQLIICGLHRGLVRGLLDRVAANATLERFVPHDPDLAGCEIEIGNLPAATHP